MNVGGTAIGRFLFNELDRFLDVFQTGMREVHGRHMQLLDSVLLVRFHWPVMDRAPGTVPVRTELLEDVANIELRFLDQSGTWHLEWPPTGIGGPDTLVMRPRVIDFTLELDDFGRVWRYVETGG